VIKEIRSCKEMGFREIFDDAASLATGEWRDEFIEKLKPLNIKFSCNMRFSTMKPTDYLAMKNAGFRMMLYGLESANQNTLERINKGVNLEYAINELKLASRYGLEPHVAVMFGYPWETNDDAIRTLKLVQWLLRKGYAKTAQASLYTPPTGLHRPAMQHFVPKIYHAAFYPDFWFNRLKAIRSIDDIKYIWKGIKSCFGL